MQDEESASRVALTGAGGGGHVSAERQQPRLCILFTATCFYWAFFFLFPCSCHRQTQYRAPESLLEVSLIEIVSPLTLAALIWCFATLKEDVSPDSPQQSIASVDPLLAFY